MSVWEGGWVCERGGGGVSVGERESGVVGLCDVDGGRGGRGVTCLRVA